MTSLLSNARSDSNEEILIVYSVPNKTSEWWVSSNNGYPPMLDPVLQGGGGTGTQGAQGPQGATGPAGGLLMMATTTLTDAQVQALGTTPDRSITRAGENHSANGNGMYVPGVSTYSASLSFHMAGRDLYD